MTPASLAYQARQLTIGILRDVEAGKINLDECGEWMRDRLCDLILRDPMLITVGRDQPVLTDAGREYLAAVDPV